MSTDSNLRMFASFWRLLHWLSNDCSPALHLQNWPELSQLEEVSDKERSESEESHRHNYVHNCVHNNDQPFVLCLCLWPQKSSMSQWPRIYQTSQSCQWSPLLGKHRHAISPHSIHHSDCKLDTHLQDSPQKTLGKIVATRRTARRWSSRGG